MTSDPQETSETVDTLGHTGERAGPDETPSNGSDVGGPASALGSGVERSVTPDDSPASEESPDSQSRNPL